MKRSVTVFSLKEDPQEAFLEITSKIDSNGISPIAIIFFSDYERFWFFSKYLHEKYPDSTSIGSTTYISLSSDAQFDASINNSKKIIKSFSAIVIFSDIEVSVGCLYEINRHPKNYKNHINKALKSLSSFENTCCLEFSTAFSMGEELVLDTFNEILEPLSIPLAGASAGNFGMDIDDVKTLVALNGDIFKNTCVFIFIHNLKGKIITYKENIFKSSGKEFVATEVDCENRTVYEYNNQPALQAMATALNVDIINIEETLKNHPMGRIFDDDILISEFNKINSDGSIRYYSRIYNRTKVAILQVDSDIESNWKNTAFNIHKNINNIDFSIVINCFSRTKLFQNKGLFDKFCLTLKENYGNYVGISGFGEQLNNYHFNQTMVIISFE